MEALQGRAFVEVIFIAIREIIQIRGRIRLVQVFDCAGDEPEVLNTAQQLPGKDFAISCRRIEFEARSYLKLLSADTAAMRRSLAKCRFLELLAGTPAPPTAPPSLNVSFSLLRC